MDLHRLKNSIGTTSALLFVCIFVAGLSAEGAESDVVPVGVAEIDITPEYPVRLSGFGFRRTESEGVTQRIWAKALAFGSDTEGPAVLVTVENKGLSLEICEEVSRRVSAKSGVKPARFTVTSTHTHTGPMLKDVSPTLFGMPVPPEHQKNIDQYTRELIDHMEQVALAAIKDIKPSRLSWGVGKFDLAVNRRTKGGPVDHDLPALFVKDLSGAVRAIYFSYACHCVVLSNNKISGDWAGFSQESVQSMFPGAIALASLGCGADSNPKTGVVGDDVQKCATVGRELAAEIKRICENLKPIAARPAIASTRIAIPFDTPRTREEWETRAKSTDAAVAFQAKATLTRLDRGEMLPKEMLYLIQTWIFGDQLAIIFLPGETVVDYSLRLKRELDRTRVWVNGYSNEERCYVPSERILKEGGYEGGGAMIYYDRPQRFAPGVEQRIIDVIHEQVPKAFTSSQGTVP
jgi:hypothetical protein